jgi:hypothetical protein
MWKVSFNCHFHDIEFTFCLLCCLGWRVSAEQQLSDLQLQTQTLLDSSAADPASAEINTSNLEALQAQMLDNMKSAAKSIYEQYLSEKVCNQQRNLFYMYKISVCKLFYAQHQ